MSLRRVSAVVVILAVVGGLRAAHAGGLSTTSGVVTGSNGLPTSVGGIDVTDLQCLADPENLEAAQGFVESCTNIGANADGSLFCPTACGDALNSLTQDCVDTIASSDNLGSTYQLVFDACGVDYTVSGSASGTPEPGGADSGSTTPAPTPRPTRRRTPAPELTSTPTPAPTPADEGVGISPTPDLSGTPPTQGGFAGLGNVVLGGDSGDPGSLGGDEPAGLECLSTSENVDATNDFISDCDFATGGGLCPPACASSLGAISQDCIDTLANIQEDNLGDSFQIIFDACNIEYSTSGSSGGTPPIDAPTTDAPTSEPDTAAPITPDTAAPITPGAGSLPTSATTTEAPTGFATVVPGGTSGSGTSASGSGTTPTATEEENSTPAPTTDQAVHRTVSSGARKVLCAAGALLLALVG